MATRLYFRHDLIRMGFFSTNWAQVYAALPQGRFWGLSTSKMSSAVNYTAATNTTPTNPSDILWTGFVSAPLQAQTLSGTVSAQIRSSESTANANAQAQMKIYVIDSSGNITATLYSGYTGAATNEFATTLTNRTYPANGAVSITSTAVSAGARILVMIGTRSYGTTAHTANIMTTEIGTDLPADNTTTTAGCPWIEFSGNFTFNTETYVPFTESFEGDEDDAINFQGKDTIKDLWGEQTPPNVVIRPTEGQLWPRGIR